MASLEGNGTDGVKLAAGADPFGMTGGRSLPCARTMLEMSGSSTDSRGREAETTERRIHEVDVNG